MAELDPQDNSQLSELCPLSTSSDVFLSSAIPEQTINADDGSLDWIEELPNGVDAAVNVSGLSERVEPVSSTFSTVQDYIQTGFSCFNESISQYFEMSGVRNEPIMRVTSPTGHLVCDVGDIDYPASPMSCVSSPREPAVDILECSLCSEIFSDDDELLNHMAEHNRSPRFPGTPVYSILARTPDGNYDRVGDFITHAVLGSDESLVQSPESDVGISEGEIIGTLEIEGDTSSEASPDKTQGNVGFVFQQLTVSLERYERVRCITCNQFLSQELTPGKQVNVRVKCDQCMAKPKRGRPRKGTRKKVHTESAGDSSSDGFSPELTRNVRRTGRSLSSLDRLTSPKRGRKWALRSSQGELMSGKGSRGRERDELFPGLPECNVSLERIVLVQCMECGDDICRNDSRRLSEPVRVRCRKCTHSGLSTPAMMAKSKVKNALNISECRVDVSRRGHVNCAVCRKRFMAVPCREGAVVKLVCSDCREAQSNTRFVEDENMIQKKQMVVTKMQCHGGDRSGPSSGEGLGKKLAGSIANVNKFRLSDCSVRIEMCDDVSTKILDINTKTIQCQGTFKSKRPESSTTSRSQIPKAPVEGMSPVEPARVVSKSPQRSVSNLGTQLVTIDSVSPKCIVGMDRSADINCLSCKVKLCSLDSVDRFVSVVCEACKTRCGDDKGERSERRGSLIEPMQRSLLGRRQSHPVESGAIISITKHRRSVSAIGGRIERDEFYSSTSKFVSPSRKSLDLSKVLQVQLWKGVKCIECRSVLNEGMEGFRPGESVNIRCESCRSKRKRLCRSEGDLHKEPVIKLQKLSVLQCEECKENIPLNGLNKSVVVKCSKHTKRKSTSAKVRSCIGCGKEIRASIENGRTFLETLCSACITYLTSDSTHQPHQQNLCIKCDIHISDAVDYFEHMWSHKHREAIVCVLCGSEMYHFTDPLESVLCQDVVINLIRQHSLTHFGHSSLNCLICPFKMVTDSDIKRHSFSHPYLGDLCIICGKNCESRNQLKAHNATHFRRPVFDSRREIPQRGNTSLTTRALRGGDTRMILCSDCGLVCEAGHRCDSTDEKILCIKCSCLMSVAYVTDENLGFLRMMCKSCSPVVILD